MAIALRDARRGDELAVAEVHVRSWREAYRELMPAEFLAGLDPRDRAERYEFEAGEGKPTTVVATSGEAVLGFVTFGPSRDQDAEGLGEVYALYVDPDRHEGGLGRMLMAEARRRLVDAGFEAAVLWVLQGNERAASFYERDGWRPDGATRVEQPYGIVSSVRRFRRAL
ncbi:MAG TPA: GNAT family N-acetyltransferase [Solirubrobacterales bacterium]|nr:GNAT family N-acetyltransferase [Solirubrobacterales bacterium]